jgi:hypothetical protein
MRSLIETPARGQIDCSSWETPKRNCDWQLTLIEHSERRPAAPVSGTGSGYEGRVRAHARTGAKLMLATSNRTIMRGISRLLFEASSRRLTIKRRSVAK